MIKIEWAENKSVDWKVCTVVNESGATIENVSANRKNKKGEIFPNFDGITPGAEVEGELWQSSADKWYLFAPKPKGEGMGSRPAWAKKPDMTKVMEKKEASIEKAQDNKAEGIKISSTMRMAVDLALAEAEGARHEGNTGFDFSESIMRWRVWLWNTWEADDSKFPPFN